MESGLDPAKLFVNLFGKPLSLAMSNSEASSPFIYTTYVFSPFVSCPSKELRVVHSILLSSNSLVRQVTLREGDGPKVNQQTFAADSKMIFPDVSPTP